MNFLNRHGLFVTDFKNSIKLKIVLDVIKIDNIFIFKNLEKCLMQI